MRKTMFVSAFDIVALRRCLLEVFFLFCMTATIVFFVFDFNVNKTTVPQAYLLTMIFGHRRLIVCTNLG